MRKKMYDKNGKSFYIKRFLDSPLNNVKVWFFEHIGGRICAISMDDNDIPIQWPITPFISARKFKELKKEARTLYPDEEFPIAMNIVLKNHGLIIR